MASGRTAVAKENQFTAALELFLDRGNGRENLLGFLSGNLLAEGRVVVHFHFNGSRDFGDDVAGRLFFFAEKRVQEAGFADLVAQFAMFEEDVHRFPERVIEDFDDLLVDEGVFRDRGRGVRAFEAGQGKGHGSALVGRAECRPNLEIPVGRTEAHDDIVRVKKNIEPGSEFERKIQGRKGTFAHDDRVYKFHGDVLSVGRVRTSSEGEQAAATEKAIGHFAASLGEAARFR